MSARLKIIKPFKDSNNNDVAETSSAVNFESEIIRMPNHPQINEAVLQGELQIGSGNPSINIKIELIYDEQVTAGYTNTNKHTLASNIGTASAFEYDLSLQEWFKWAPAFKIHYEVSGGTADITSIVAVRGGGER